MTKQKAPADVVPGDRRFRRRMLILCGLLALASLYAAYGVHANLQRQFSLSVSDPPAAMENMVHVIRCVSLSAAIIFVGFAAWFGALACFGLIMLALAIGSLLRASERTYDD